MSDCGCRIADVELRRLDFGIKKSECKSQSGNWNLELKTKETNEGRQGEGRQGDL